MRVPKLPFRRQAISYGSEFTGSLASFNNYLIFIRAKLLGHRSSVAKTNFYFGVRITLSFSKKQLAGRLRKVSTPRIDFGHAAGVRLVFKSDTGSNAVGLPGGPSIRTEIGRVESDFDRFRKPASDLHLRFERNREFGQPFKSTTATPIPCSGTIIPVSRGPPVQRSHRRFHGATVPSLRPLAGFRLRIHKILGDIDVAVAIAVEIFHGESKAGEICARRGRS